MPIRNAKQLCKILAHDLSYNEGAKQMFHKYGKSVLRDIAARLNLKPGTYEVRSNMGGIAVSGEVTLHCETLYVQFSQFSTGCGQQFMFRSCKGLKDYTGGANQWAHYSDLASDEKSIIYGLKKAGDL